MRSTLILGLLWAGVSGCLLSGGQRDLDRMRAQNEVARAEEKRYAEERRLQAARRRREDECAPPWLACRGCTARDKPLDAFVEAKGARERDESQLDGRHVVTGEPSGLYVQFHAWSERLAALDAVGCNEDASAFESQCPPGETDRRRGDLCDMDRNAFDVEWAYLQAIELERQNALVRVVEVQQTARELLAAAAKAHGYDRVSVDVGLIALVQEVIARAIPEAKLKRIAIVLNGGDADLVVNQVLGKGEALFTSQGTDLRIWLRAYSGSLYEGTPLTALDMPAVVIVGVKEYRTVIGGTAQAFVLEPAW